MLATLAPGERIPPLESTLDDRSRWSMRPLAGLLALLVLARSALVAVLGDVFFYGDEFEKGAAAKAMLAGLGRAIGHHRLAYHYYEGGGFVVSHLDALAFLLLGENLLALKAVALLLNALILAAGYFLCRRAFGDRAAVLFGLLFVLAPESVQKNSMIALGIHYDGLLFFLLVLLFGGRAVIEREVRPRVWFALGLAAGFGTYFSYPCGLTVAFVGLCLLVFRRAELFGARGAAGLAGLVLGAAPLIAMWSLVGAEVLDIHGTPLFGGFVPSERVALLGAFLRSIYDPVDPASLATAVLLPLGTIVGFASLVRGPGEPGEPGEDTRAPRAWAWFLAGSLLTFTAAYVCSGFAVGEVAHFFLFHRLSQPWVLAALLTAGGAAALTHDAGAARVVGWGLVAASLFLGGLGCVRAVARGNRADLGANLAVLRRTKGYRYDEYVAKIWHHLEGDGPARARQLLELDDPDPALLDYTLAVNLFGPAEYGIDEVRRIVTALDPGREQDWYVGLGPMWRVLHGDLGIADRLRLVLADPALPDAMRPPVTESFGRFGLGFLVTEDRLRDEVREGLDHELPEAYFRGLGYRLYSVRGDRDLVGFQRQTNSPFFIDPDRGLAFIARQPPGIREALRQGYARARDEHSLP